MQQVDYVTRFPLKIAGHVTLFGITTIDKTQMVKPEVHSPSTLPRLTDAVLLSYLMLACVGNYSLRSCCDSGEVLTHELADFENPYMMRRSALERLLQERVVRNQLDERCLPRLLDRHPDLVKCIPLLRCDV